MGMVEFIYFDRYAEKYTLRAELIPGETEHVMQIGSTSEGLYVNIFIPYKYAIGIGIKISIDIDLAERIFHSLKINENTMVIISDGHYLKILHDIGILDNIAMWMLRNDTDTAQVVAKMCEYYDEQTATMNSLMTEYRNLHAEAEVKHE